MAPHRAVTVDTGGAGDPKFRDLCTVCPELASKRRYKPLDEIKDKYQEELYSIPMVDKRA
jgi:hypothetical protein